MQDAYQLANEYVRHTNRCIFLTGKAGTGKTTFLRNLLVAGGKQMAIVAPTGVAAINAGGATIHSFFQLPPQLFLPTPEARNQLFAEMQMRRQKIQVLRNLELLIIDEISMVRSDLLDAIDAILRHYRHRNLPFGGVQMLFIGDLFQLSPVARRDEWPLLRPYYEGPYFFQANVFREVQPVYIELDHVFRQTNQQFVEVLNQVRNNCLTDASRQLLNTRYQPDYKNTDDEYHIILSTHNQKVDTINQDELSRLPGKAHRFFASVEGQFPESMYPIDKELILKEGARVMFVKNDTSPEHLYYNGKLGRVTSIRGNEIVVETEDGDITVGRETWENLRYEPGTTAETVRAEKVGTFSQVPLRLAWAITIHKSQGLTFDDVVIDAADAFASGQVYVALSRCRSLEGIILLSPIPSSALTNDQQVLRYTNQQPSLAEVQNNLLPAEIDYLTLLLTSLFDFRESLHRINLLRSITSKEAAYSADTADFLNRLRTDVEQLQQVGERFQLQLRAIILSEVLTPASAPSPNNQSSISNKQSPIINNQSPTALKAPKPSLPGRLKAAWGYYEPLLSDLVERIKQSPCTTDNQDSRADFEEQINTLYCDLMRQLHQMRRMTAAPSIQTYQSARAAFRVPSFHISASTEKLPDLDSLPNAKLLRALYARRRAIAQDAGVEPYVVAKSDSLKDIARLLPLTKKELMKVKGFGKVKYDIWGDEILQMVARYIASDPTLRSRFSHLPKSLLGKLFS